METKNPKIEEILSRGNERVRQTQNSFAERNKDLEEKENELRKVQEAFNHTRKEYEDAIEKTVSLRIHYNEFRGLMDKTQEENRSDMRMDNLKRWKPEATDVELDPMYKRLELIHAMEEAPQAINEIFNVIGDIWKRMELRQLSQLEYAQLERGDHPHPILQKGLKKAIKYEKAGPLMKRYYRHRFFSNMISWGKDGFHSLCRGI